MHKRILAILGATLLFLSVACLAAAAENPAQGQPSALSAEQQQADENLWRERIQQLRGEFLENLVKVGALTREEAAGRLKETEGGAGFRSPHGFAVPCLLEPAQLNEDQKAEMRKWFEQRLTTCREALDGYVCSGQISRTQADSQLQRMQTRFTLVMENGFACGSGKNKGARL